MDIPRAGLRGQDSAERAGGSIETIVPAAKIATAANAVPCTAVIRGETLRAFECLSDNQCIRSGEASYVRLPTLAALVRRTGPATGCRRKYRSLNEQRLLWPKEECVDAAGRAAVSRAVDLVVGCLWNVES